MGILQEDSGVPTTLENTIPTELIVGQEQASEVLERESIVTLGFATQYTKRSQRKDS